MSPFFPLLGDRVFLGACRAFFIWFPLGGLVSAGHILDTRFLTLLILLAHEIPPGETLFRALPAFFGSRRRSGSFSPVGRSPSNALPAVSFSITSLRTKLTPSFFSAAFTTLLHLKLFARCSFFSVPALAWPIFPVRPRPFHDRHPLLIRFSLSFRDPETKPLLPWRRGSFLRLGITPPRTTSSQFYSGI